MKVGIPVMMRKMNMAASDKTICAVGDVQQDPNDDEDFELKETEAIKERDGSADSAVEPCSKCSRAKETKDQSTECIGDGGSGDEGSGDEGSGDGGSGDGCPADEDKSKSGLSWKKACAVGIIAGGAAVVAAPLALGAVGFTAGGVAAGSLAAGVQSAVYGGAVASGSVFAVLQSAGAAGLGAIGNAAVFSSAATAAGGGTFLIDKIGSLFKRKSNSK
ncbi:glycine-rich protein 1 [Exaiptasia diaphana]|uniref:Uncharacterized protein n=1 Tax=Exaiptasia diaphana TaxID=2652724 RepID=A0A913Y5Z5_EXADI|nr:glycine-rich protein 1 [Exaiptasia diaphana]